MATHLQEPELTVVMPVYNEEQAVGAVVRAWISELDRLGVDYGLRAYDDGSTDRTREALAALAASFPRVTVVDQENRGHGPTVLRGYREARSDWVFQTDSDGELGPEGFAPLWRRRQGFDLLVGYRNDRHAPAIRRWLTAAARLATRLLFGRTVRDVNVPYRLMRRDALRPLLAYLPARTFAPNVALSGLAAAARLRVFESEVRSRKRAAGETSLRRFRLLKAVLRSLVETATVARRFRTGQGARPSTHPGPAEKRPRPTSSDRGGC